MGNLKSKLLFDTGASRSCLSTAVYEKLKLSCPDVSFQEKPSHTKIKSATGDSLKPQFRTLFEVVIGRHLFEFDFVVCDNMEQVILGRDMHRKYLLTLRWDKTHKQLTEHLWADDKKIAPNLALPSHMPLWFMTLTKTTIPPLQTAIVKCVTMAKYKSLRHYPPGNYEFAASSPRVLQDPTIVLHETVHQISDLRDLLYVPITNTSTVPLILQKNEQVCELHPLQTECELYHLPSCTEEPAKEKDKESDAVSAEEPTALLTHENTDTKRRIILDKARVYPDLEKELNSFLTEKYPELLSKDSTDIGLHDAKLKIPVDGPPCAARPYTVPLKHANWVRKEIQALLRSGVIRPSLSPWASPCILVRKKLDLVQSQDLKARMAEGEVIDLKQYGDLRLVIDYRAVNTRIPKVDKVSKGSKISKSKGSIAIVPIPRINEIYARLLGARYFSVIDLRAAFHNLTLHEDSIPITAFVLPWGKYEFVRVPFGLQTSPSWFQGLINKCMEECMDFAFAYMDDILIYTNLYHAQTVAKHHFPLKTWDQLNSQQQDWCFQRAHLDQILSALKKLLHYGLKIKQAKCEFFQLEVQYLGHVISEKGMTPVKEKVQAIKTLLSPQTVTEVRQFLGVVGYYRAFIDHFSAVAKPLHNLCKKDAEWDWSPACEKAFKHLQHALCSNSVLIYPDPNDTYHLFCDASKHGYASVLTQIRDEIYRPITYLSGTFRTKSQIAQPIIVKECYAIYQAVKKLDFYLRGASTIVHSDHKPLEKFLHQSLKCDKLTYWSLELAGYDLSFQYVSSKDNFLADAFSRLKTLELVEEHIPSMDDVRFHEKFPDLDERECSEPAYLNSLLANNNTMIHRISQEINNHQKEVLIALQQADPHIDQIRKLKDQKPHKKAKFLMDEDILYRSVSHEEKLFHATVLPPKMVEALIYEFHDLMGHPGISCTFEHIRRYYFTPGLKTLVEKHVQQCKVCNMQKKTQLVPYSKSHLPIPAAPMDCISIDLIGPFQLTTGDLCTMNRYALTAIDNLTLYVWAVPIPDKTSKTIADQLIKRVFCDKGFPRRIVSDNAKEFQAHTLNDILEIFGIKHSYTSVYNPRANLVERAHSFLKRVLRSYLVQPCPQVKWDNILAFATFSWNAMPHTGLKDSPFFLMMGRDPILMAHKLVEPKLRTLFDEGHLNLEELYTNWMKALITLRETRDSSLDHSNATEFGKFPHGLQPGDYVMVKNHTPQDAFAPKFVDGYRVQKVLNANSVELKELRTGRLFKQHVKYLKKDSPQRMFLASIPDVHLFGRLGKYVNDPRRFQAKQLETIADTLSAPRPKVVNHRYFLRSGTRATEDP